jgi:hypothetical protein
MKREDAPGAPDLGQGPTGISRGCDLTPQAGRVPAPQGGCMGKVRLVLAVLTIIGLCSCSSKVTPKKTNAGASDWPSAELRSRARSAVEGTVSIGLITKIDPKTNEAWIEPGIWSQIDYSLKRDIAATLAVYFEQVGGAAGRRSYLRDRYTGKQLAHCGPTGDAEIDN